MPRSSPRHARANVVAAAIALTLAPILLHSCKARQDGSQVASAGDSTDVDVAFTSTCSESRQFVMDTPTDNPDTSVLGGDGSDGSPVEAALTDSTDVGSAAFDVFTKHCNECHSSTATNGRLGNVLDYNTAIAVKGIIDIQLGDGQDATTALMPPKTRPDLRLSLADIQTLRAWARSETPPIFPGQSAGAPTLPASGAVVGYVDHDDEFDNSVPFISKASQFACVKKDFARLPKLQRKFVRYVSMTHLYNAALRDNWKQKKSALYKAVNSISHNSVVINPIPIDRTTMTIFRVDLRAYGFDDAPHMALWDKTAALDPYKGGDTVVVDGTDLRPVRADWFINQILKAPTYYQFIEAPLSLNDFQDKYHLNMPDQFNNLSVRRGVFRSELTGNHKRVVQMVRGGDLGLFWEVMDFGHTNCPDQSVLDPVANPFGPTFAGAQSPFNAANDCASILAARAFDSTITEVAYNLKNGFFAYLVYGDAQSAAFNLAETNALVADASDPQHQTRSGASCITCHAKGPEAFNDVLGGEARRITSKVDIPKNSLFTADQAQALAILYPDTLDINNYVNGSIQKFAKASAQVGVGADQILQEPVKAMLGIFNAPVTQAEAAAEFGLSAGDFLNRVRQSPDAGSELSGLVSASGAMGRDEFQGKFAAMAPLITQPNGAGAGGSGSTPTGTGVAVGGAPGTGGAGGGVSAPSAGAATTVTDPNSPVTCGPDTSGGNPSGAVMRNRVGTVICVNDSIGSCVRGANAIKNGIVCCINTSSVLVGDVTKDPDRRSSDLFHRFGFVELNNPGLVEQECLTALQASGDFICVQADNHLFSPCKISDGSCLSITSPTLAACIDSVIKAGDSAQPHAPAPNVGVAAPSPADQAAKCDCFNKNLQCTSNCGGPDAKLTAQCNQICQLSFLLCKQDCGL